MSYRLQLLALQSRSSIAQEKWWPETVLTLDNDYRVIGQLYDLGVYATDRQDIPSKPTIPTMPLPPGTQVDHPEGVTATDVHDDLLRWLFAQELKALKIPEDATWKDKAVKAFIGEMPDDLPVVLYPC